MASSGVKATEVCEVPKWAKIAMGMRKKRKGDNPDWWVPETLANLLDKILVERSQTKEELRRPEFVSLFKECIGLYNGLVDEWNREAIKSNKVVREAFQTGAFGQDTFKERLEDVLDPLYI